MARRWRLVERREQLGLTQAEVAKAALCDKDTYRRYESGRSTPRPGDRRPLAKALRWTTTELALALNDEAEPLNGHVVPRWLDHLASLEQAAAEIQAFEPIVVHGLLQTADYATAVESIGSFTEAHIAEKVRLRLARQAVLTRVPDPLRLSVILDESVLHRIAKNRDVMADQFDHMADLAETPNVTVQIMPLSSAVFPAAFGAFSLITSPDADSPFMACVEDGAGPHYLDRPYDIDHHRDLFRHLQEAALSPLDSVDLIRRIAKESYR
jgi:transcriptional regulator with XRE-family HTH domain